ncbi:IclR family transcriptional regulator [Marispirochaeta sp.]|jgi:IclR family transcriptional regulator, KDG regulon repressor|uniref:IclR family transcriptional regulator n=1 Tax=Marispirochaeta sp. TaxID=2038653 RepID=UPI0029C6D4E8
MQVLECFSMNKPQLGITELSSMSGMTKSNVYNIVSTFRALGYIQKNSQTEKYYLGHKFLQFANLAGDLTGLFSKIPESIKNVAQEAQELCYFAIEKNNKIVYINAAYPLDSALSFPSISGSGVTADMHVTALGKAILASHGIEYVKGYVRDKELRKYTENSITDPDALLVEIEKTRIRGYAIDDMEHIFGIKCVARAVHAPSGSVLGAISIAGPSLRFNEDKIQQFAQILEKHIKQLELNL